MTNKIKKGIKPIKAWAVCFALNRKCLGANTVLFPTRIEAKTYIKEFHKSNGGFEDDHHIIKVLITPIQSKFGKKKVRKE